MYALDLHENMCNVVKIKSCPRLVTFGVLCMSMRVCLSMHACLNLCPAIRLYYEEHCLNFALSCMIEEPVFSQASKSLRQDGKKSVSLFLSVCVRVL